MNQNAGNTHVEVSWKLIFRNISENAHLTHTFPMNFSLQPENIRKPLKPYGFLMFSGGREWMHRELMG